MKVSFLSVFAFDANISLIDSLKTKCEISFFTEALHKVYNYIDREQLKEFVTVGKDVEQIKCFQDLIPLDNTYVIKGTRSSDIFRKIYNSYKINQLIKKINPDVIIIDNITFTYLWSAIRLRKKALLIVHDPFQHSGEEFVIDKYLRKFFFKLIDNKILLNNTQKDQFILENKEENENIHTSFLSVYNYLTYYNDPVKNMVTDEFNILFFGRISSYKGIQFLLDTYTDMISSKYQDITLTIAGSGDFDFDIDIYKSNPNIKILNKFVSPEELALLINDCSVVVCPYTDATQSGVVMSAFAFKKPVIATNVGGLPEMVTHQKTGIIIEKNNKKQLSEAIVLLYSNREIIETMSVNIESEYFNGDKSWKHSGELFFKAIQSVYQNS